MNKIIEQIEAHIEKGVLGIAALGALAMLWLFILNSPNTVSYSGQELGPAELSDKILSDAEALDRVVRSKQADTEPIEDYSALLRRRHQDGVFAESTPVASVADGAAQEEAVAPPPLPQTLPRVAALGEPIEVPGLAEEEGAADIQLIRPLRPTQPVVRAGRSTIVRSPIALATTTEGFQPPTEEETPKAESVTWATIAAYFDVVAQFNEAVKAGYASYRAKAYVTGVDVERQVMLPSGEWSPWESIAVTDAMPTLNLPEPELNPETGEIENKDEIRSAFALVKREQPTLRQPPFFEVRDGDYWRIPEIEGYAAVDTEIEIPEAKETATATREPTRNPGRSPGGRTGGRTGGRGRTSGVSTPSAGGGTQRGGRGAATSGESRADARRRVNAALEETRRLLAQKRWEEARNAAKQILDDTDANRGQQDDAGRYWKIATKRIQEREMAQMGPGNAPTAATPAAGAGGTGLGRLAGRAAGGRQATGRTVGRGGRMAGAPGQTPGAAPAPAAGATPAAPEGRRTEPEEVVYRPESTAPAVWYHDTTVEPGKTYRYRMRVNLWNRYVGRIHNVADEQDAKRTTISGEWSIPSAPVTVAPETYFFVRSANESSGTARVDVWRWIDGFWRKASFEVAVGDVIAGKDRVEVYVKQGEQWVPEDKEFEFDTGAIVLDIQYDVPVLARRVTNNAAFDYRETDSVVITYIDPADGQVKQRIAAYDRYDPKRDELEEQLL